jgi:hypothetical protein
VDGGSASGSSSGGEGGASGALPQALVDVQIASGMNSTTQCPLAGEQTWNVGYTGQDPAPIPNGTSQGGELVTVSCSVVPAGSGFAVAGDVQLAGQGSLTLKGNFDGTTNAQPNIQATFQLASGSGDWTETACTATFSSVDMGIAAGRVWAHLDCPAMTDSSHGTQCDGQADFRLENCAELAQ